MALTRILNGDFDKPEKFIMKQIAALIIFACTVSAFASAQTSKEKSRDADVKQVILQLEDDGREATLKNDIAANDRLLADNWVNVNPDGSITTKTRLMELLKQGTFKINSIENDEVMVRVFDEAAVVTGRSTTKRLNQKNEMITRQVRFTRVYAKSKGQWRVVSAHNTLIAQP